MPEPDRPHQVVGIDGSSGSEHALAWAIARTSLLGPVKPVAAWHYPWWVFVPTGAGTAFPPDEQQLVAATEKLVENSLEGLDRSDVSETTVIHGSAGEALVSVGVDGSLLVVGTRGRSAVAAGLLGSVSAHCVKHANGPVAVIPQETSIEDRFGSVIVGHDGSEFADRALEWALAHTPPSTEIVVVHVWNPQQRVSAKVEALAAEQLSAASLAEAKNAVERARSVAGFADRRLTAVSESGDPREVLGTLSQTADMLVVGSRGHGGVAYLLLGSVASALVQHPLTATVVVRAEIVEQT